MAYDNEVTAAELRSRRARLRWSRDQLAEKSGICKASLSDYETGKTVPLLSNAYALAEALGCSINDLCGWGAEASVK